MRNMIIILLSLLVVTGCGRKTKSLEQIDPAEVARQKLAALMASARDAETAGDTNKVVILLESAIQNPEFNDNKTLLLGQLINYELYAGRSDQARSRILANIEENPNALQQVAIRLNSRYLSQGDHVTAIAWLNTLNALGLPTEVRARFSTELTSVLLKAADRETIFAHLGDILNQDGVGATPSVQRVLDHFTVGQDLESVDAVLALLASHAEQNAWLGSIIDGRRLDLMGRRGAWADAEVFFGEMASRHNEKIVHDAYAVLMSRAASAGEGAMMDRVTEFALSDHADKPLLRRRAAAIWVDGSKQRKDWTQVVDRLNSLLDQGLPATEILVPYSKVIYELIQNAGPEVQQGILAIGKRMGAGELDENAVVRLKVLMFDGAFLMDDYDSVIEALEEGIPNREEEWHEMAINKVYAHKALKEGNTDEAVKRFRAFMEVTDRTWENDQVDPSSGISHSREMIMGFNATRIGNILSEAGRPDEANDAYQEAVAYYEVALNKVKPGTPEHKKIITDLKTLPTTGKGTDE